MDLMQKQTKFQQDDTVRDGRRSTQVGGCYEVREVQAMSKDDRGHFPREPRRRSMAPSFTDVGYDSFPRRSRFEKKKSISQIKCRCWSATSEELFLLNLAHRFEA